MDDIKTGDRFQLPAPSYMIMEAMDVEKHEILTVLTGKAGTWLISADAIRWFVGNMGWKRVPEDEGAA